MAAQEPLVVGIGGTTRAGSSTEKALRVALRSAAARGARTSLFTGDRLATLPLYAPEDPHRVALATELIDALRAADGVIIASPGYHGSVSGLVKNALDYTEDLRDDDRVYLSGLPVGVIATGAGMQAIGSTLSTLRDIAHALRAWPTPLGAGILTVGRVFDEHGECLDEHAAFQLRLVGQEVVQFAVWKLASPPLPDGDDAPDARGAQVAQDAPSPEDAAV
jgi:FMN reductase